MRYENPHYTAEDAGAADLIAGGRLQLGISRGSPEQVIDGWHYFGYDPVEGETDADDAAVTSRWKKKDFGIGAKQLKAEAHAVRERIRGLEFTYDLRGDCGYIESQSNAQRRN